MKSKFLLLLFAISLFASLPDGARYLIITLPEYEETLRPLAEWKTNKGIFAKIVTTDETGSTSTEIRDYIINAYTTWETPPEFVLIGASNSEIPMIYGGRTSYGSFNSDWKYGELTGDLYNDTYVGRLPANNVTRMERMVEKVLSYEKNPPDGDWIKWGTTVLRNDYDSSDLAYQANIDTCIAGMLHWGFTNIDTFNSSCCNASNVEAALNTGRSFVIYRGQGTTNWWSPFNVDPETHLTNGYKLPVVLSITCHTITGNTGAEAGTWWMRGNSTEMSGAVAFFGTTSTISHGAEVRGEVSDGFVLSYFADTTTDIGSCAENARRHMFSIYADTAQYTSHVLLGDPEMDIRTAHASLLYADYPALIDPMTTEVEINVTDGTSPVTNALVCIYQKEMHHAWGYTDATGNITLPFETTELGTLYVTASAKNFLPFEGTSMIFPDGPFLTADGWTMSDLAGGNGDGQANPGETIDLFIDASNSGTESATGATGLLESDDPYVAIISASQSYGSIAVDATETNDSPFQIEISGDAPDNHVIELLITISASGEDPWEFSISGPEIQKPRLRVSGYTVVDSSPFGDGDGLAEPGELFFMTTTIENDDILSLTDCEFNLTLGYENSHVFDGNTTTDTLTTGASFTNTDEPFYIAIGPNNRPNGVIPAMLHVEADAGFFTYIDSIPFTIDVGGELAGGFTGPDGYGYAIYDDEDLETGLAPDYDWLEISGIGTAIPSLTDADDAISQLTLPFPVQFYGHVTDTISVCTNGFIAIGRETWSGGSGSHEQPIPQVGQAKGFVAAFWDDMDLRTFGELYSYYDEPNHRFIVEYDNAAIYGGALIHKFQVIFRDRTYYPTLSEDTEILIQYNTLTDVRYCTVGIEDYTETDGIRYLYHNEYAPGAEELVATRTLLITTNIPVIADTLWPEIMAIRGTDSIAGDGNGMADAGEEYNIIVDIENLGAMTAPAVQCSMQVEAGLISGTARIDLGEMTPAMSKSCTLSVFIPEDLEDTTEFSVEIGVWSGDIIRVLPYVFTAYPSACTEYLWNLKRGWNIASYPSFVPYPAETLFNVAVPPIYEFVTGAYVAVDSIKAGAGYWVLMPDSVEIPQCLGDAVETVSYDLLPGWNLVGTGSAPLGTDIFDGITEIVWPIYEFSGGAYSAVDSLLPLKGYWILSSDTVSVP